MIHLVVHHRRDPRQPWPNHWIDDDILETITTTKEIGRLCEAAAFAGERVRFHRCACGTSEPVICAEARVASLHNLDRKTCLVTFDSHTVLQEPPPVTPSQGTSWYPAGSPTREERR